MKEAQTIHVKMLQSTWKWQNENHHRLLFLFWEQWATLQIEKGIKMQKVLALENLIANGKISEQKWHSTVYLV